MVRIRGLGRLKRLYARLTNISHKIFISLVNIKIQCTNKYRALTMSRQYYNPWRVRKIQVQSAKDYVEKNGRLLCDHAVIEQYVISNESVSLEDSDWRKSISYPSSYIAELKNMAFISRTSYLLSKRGELLSDDFFNGITAFGLRSKLWDMEVDKNRQVIKMPENVFNRQILDSGIYLMIEHESNYFHWLVEVLPSLYLYEKMMSERNLPLLISEGLHQNLYDILNLVKDNERLIIRIKPRSTYRIKKLVCPPIVTRIFNVYDREHDVDTVYVPVGLMKLMVKAIKSKMRIDEDKKQHRLFIKRTSTYRHLLNQDEIEAVLIERGFKVIDPAVMSVEEQISVFSNAEMIIGATGAAMTNMIWCRPGTHVVILHSHIRGKKYPYWNALARVAGANIQYVYGERAFNKIGYFEAHDDYRVEVSNVLQSIDLLSPRVKVS